MKIKYCKICNKECNRTHLGMCKKHYVQYKKYGKVLDTNPRTVWEPNDVRIFANYAEIDTYDSLGNVLDTYIIDVEDVTLLGNHKWRSVIKKRKEKELHYLGTKHTIYFHRLITGNPDIEVDHINKNTLDNRKSNLRVISNSINRINYGLPINNTSGIKGVIKRKNKYKAELQIYNKRYVSPLYDSIEEATYYRHLLEQHFIPDFKVNNTQLMNEYINKLSDNTKKIIQTYFANKLKS